MRRFALSVFLLIPFLHGCDKISSFERSSKEPSSLPVSSLAEAIKGKDLNSNGIRDDVEQYLPGLSGDESNIKHWSRLAKSMQSAIQLNENASSQDFKDIHNEFINAYACIQSINSDVDKNFNSNEFRILKKITVNNHYRNSSWKNYEAKSLGFKDTPSKNPCLVEN